MTVLVTINSNNPLVAGSYSTVDAPTMLSTLAPILALVTPVTVSTVDDAVRLFNINGHVTYLNYQ
jgi:hypothetical protein